MPPSPSSSSPPSQPSSSPYSHTASRGLIYPIPHATHMLYKQLLKALPSSAREIYRGYFTDILGGYGHAGRSAVLMGEFIREHFVEMGEQHDAVAGMVNAEINKHEHDYEPVLLPLVRNGDGVGLTGSGSDSGRRSRSRSSGSPTAQTSSARRGRHAAAAAAAAAATTTAYDTISTSSPSILEKDTIKDAEQAGEVKSSKGKARVGSNVVVLNTSVDGALHVQGRPDSEIDALGGIEHSDMDEWEQGLEAIEAFDWNASV